VAKRAKRSNRFNPRQDRNSNDFNYTPRNIRNGKREDNTRSNVIDFPHTPIKKRVEIIPRNLNQEDLLSALEDDKKHIVFATGPAGTGKTHMCTLYAIKMLREGKVKKIVVTRPNVAVDDKDIGYLPGDILGKMLPWLKPITDEMADYYKKTEIESMIKDELIEVVPIAYMRGRSFKNTVILVDEAQGTTDTSLLSILTRIGEDSKILVTGDLNQSDRGSSNGLKCFLDRLGNSHIKGLAVVRFEQNDVVRHEIIKDILKLYGQN
jgi:phosphate starvation-inducible PhoH-like protein